MPTVATLLDWCEARLHAVADTGAIWTRAELLRYLNDAYRDFLARTHAARRLLPLDLPDTHTYAVTYEWEHRFTATAPAHTFTRPVRAGTLAATGLWEASVAVGLDPAESEMAFAFAWEAVFAGDQDRHYRFALPADSDRVVEVRYKDQRLAPVSVRELDTLETDWFARVGEPRLWTTGAGRIRTIEVYEILLDRVQGYALLDADAGLPRGFSGDRTYVVDADPIEVGYAYTTGGDSDALTTRPAMSPGGLGVRITTAADDATDGYGLHAWEVQIANGATPTATSAGLVGAYTWERRYGATEIAWGVGTVRRIRSTTRQYWPVGLDPTTTPHLGTIRDWRSSENSLMVLESVVPDVALGETDVPALIPGPMQKYLRFGVLARARGKSGEGHSSIDAEHWQRRFERGLEVMTRLASTISHDRAIQRDTVTPQPRQVQKVRLPSTFERQL